MAVRQRVLIPWACSCIVALSGQTARADFLGVATVVRTDLTICQDTSQDDIDEPLTVCNFFAVFNSPTDRLHTIGNSDISTSDPAGFFQFPSPATDLSPDCDSIPMIPALVCDSFITIGVDCDDGTDATRPDGDWDSGSFNTAGQMHGGWFNANPAGGQGDAGSYPNDLVLFLQIAIARGESVSGGIDVFWEDTTTGEIFAEVDVLLECPGPCPGDLNVDGTVGPFDLALLLGSWGPNPGDPADLDGDGVVGASDLAILLGAWGPCCNGVGISDGAEPDADGDGFVDECDNCPELFNATQNDCDEDGMGDACTLSDGIEGDCNDNGLPDNCEDCNENDIADECDLADGTSPDCNTNEVPDECEPQSDCNENGAQDICDIAEGTSNDCNGNGIPDECEQPDDDGDGVPNECDNCDLFNPEQTDCQPNDIGDVCDLADGTSEDCNANNVPDECEGGCNDNSVPDECDINDGTSEDCNDNAVPDECDPQLDCNENGVQDVCDIAAGTSQDTNSNDYPDECVEPFTGFPSARRIVADLDGDGIEEVLQTRLGSSGLEVQVFNVVDDTPSFLSGWPQPIVGSAPPVPPAVGEVNLGQDGPEIVIVTRSGADLELYIFDLAGTVLLHRSYVDIKPRGLALADLDDDGDDEIIVAGLTDLPFSSEALVAVYQEDGSLFDADWPQVFGPHVGANHVVETGLAVGDLDGDGDLEIICTSEIVGAVGQSKPSEIAVFNADGSDAPGWENQLTIPDDEGGINRPVLADLDGDDTLEIIVSTFGDDQLAYLHVYRADGVDLGRALLSAHSGPPVIGDLNNDAEPEIIVNAGSNIHIFDRFLQPIIVMPGGQGEIVLADVDPGVPVEIIVRSSNVLNAYRFTNGSQPFSWPVPVSGSEGLVAGNFDNDDELELLIGSTLVQTDTVFNPFRIEWAMYQHDPQHSGRYRPACPDDVGGEDCTGNGIPDVCEPDCNNNSQADSCDIADGISVDCNTNEIPDECESPADCNDNGVQDICDIGDGTSADCDGNDVPDECQNTSADCNDNGVWDACDIADGTSEDCNGNGVPNECQPAGPVITQQPVSQEVEPGDLAFFGVGAEGFLLDYQWRKDGVDLEDNEHIFGSQSAGLVILEAAPADAGEYDCVITDFWGCQIVSDPATLAVLPP